MSFKFLGIKVILSLINSTYFRDDTFVSISSYDLTTLVRNRNSLCLEDDYDIIKALVFEFKLNLAIIEVFEFLSEE